MTQGELFERDRVLDCLEDVRAELIDAATVAARIICERRGSVTSVQVFRYLRECGYGRRLDAVDPRWMGAVFRSGKGWKRVGWDQTGSHGRPVAVWVRR